MNEARDKLVCEACGKRLLYPKVCRMGPGALAMHVMAVQEHLLGSVSYSLLGLHAVGAQVLVAVLTDCDDMCDEV